MKKMCFLTIALLAICSRSAVAANSDTPMKVGIVGLTHGHIEFSLRGGSLAPAGGLLNRPDIQIVGIVEPDRALFDSYAQRHHIPASLYFHNIQEMVAQVHPQAVLVFTAPSEHRRVVEECAALGVHVMVEKPLAISYKDALAIQDAAQRGHIHVLVNLETTWYASNSEAFRLLKQGSLGPIVKAIFRDGHRGPKLLGKFGPEFLNFLGDPNQNGGGALYDFGCYVPLSRPAEVLDFSHARRERSSATRRVAEIYNVIDARQSEAQNTVIEALRGLGRDETALGILPSAAGGRHPAGRFHRLADYQVIGILIVMVIRIHHEYGIHLEQPEQENQTLAELDDRDIVHAMIPVIEGERFEAERLGRLLVVDLILRGAPPDARAGLLVIGQADEVAGIAFADELGDRTGAEQDDVVRMRLAHFVIGASRSVYDRSFRGTGAYGGPA